MVETIDINLVRIVCANIMFNVLQIWRKFSKDYKSKENIMEEKNDMNLVRIKKCHIIFTHKMAWQPAIDSRTSC